MSCMFKFTRITITLIAIAGFLGILTSPAQAEDGYDLWLRYRLIDNAERLKNHQQTAVSIVAAGDSPTMTVAVEELHRGLSGLLGQDIPRKDAPAKTGSILVGAAPALQKLAPNLKLPDITALGPEGYSLQSINSDSFKGTVITANTDAGVLYGVFGFLRRIQTHQPIDNLDIKQTPRIQRRMLNHWDNLSRSVEKGYAGKSIWIWDELPGKRDPRYRDYARANASVGINAVVIHNVNADPKIVSDEYIAKWAALAEELRPYNIKVYTTVNFGSPMLFDGPNKLDTADPRDPRVSDWWKERFNAIYAQVPDFGGVLVKADTEGRPGPQQFNREFTDGANMLAEAIAPHGGIVIWRAFRNKALTNNEPDVVKRPYLAYAPFDGQFADNVVIQPKYGPSDFQPREPAHPLFGAMPNTPLFLEVEITQEYLGRDLHHVYIAPLWKEILTFDTFARGRGSSVAKVIDGSLYGRNISGIAGVANVGSDRNWCGYDFGQANWYAFGRLAWDHQLSSEQIADEWLKMTFSHDPHFIAVARAIMMESWPAAVSYLRPLGFTILSAYNHYEPAPKYRNFKGGDYNIADKDTVGVDRTLKGSGAVTQYNQHLTDLLDNVDTCPLKYFLWFHRVSWNFPLPTGRTVWEEIVWQFYDGVRTVEDMNNMWATLKPYVDAERFDRISNKRAGHLEHARKWRDTCVSYFQSLNELPWPDFIESEFHQKPPTSKSKK
ncbi:MAG: hypothetical protein JW709_01730 [Sedimentisphaerales bacterium]|nr:hypothetical protein [Sedimentisphaerales bacterium]